MIGSKALRFLLPFLFGSAITLNAQKAPMKFGKVDIADLNLSDCSFEPGVAAMVLCDYSEAEFSMDNPDADPAFEQKRHKRIKIFTQKGLDQANVRLSFYVGKSGDFEKIRDIKAQCHYLENGQVKTLELSQKDIYTNDVGYGYREVKFAIPGAREGCIVEYKYEFYSRDISNLNSWYFQEEIPVLYSECRMAMPKFLVYQKVLRGEFSLSIQEESVERRSYRVRQSHIAERSMQGNYETEYNIFRWAMKDVASLDKELWMGPPADFSAHLEFQLQVLQFESGRTFDMMSSYEKFTKKLLKDEDFGKYAEPGRFEKDLVEEICGIKTEPRSKAAAILHHLGEKVKWNGVYALYTGQSASKTYSKGSGSIAEINLLAVACLRAAGLNADPVLLGTRDHARPHPVFPNIKRFNYIAIAIEIDSQLVLADATENDLPLGFLPEKCLHGDGWRVSNHTPGFIPLQQNAFGRKTTYIQIQPDGEKWTGKVSFKSTEYAAAMDRIWIKDNGQHRYLAALTQPLTEWNPGNPKMTNTDDPLASIVEIPISRDIEGESTMYFKPVIAGIILENPLIAESRHWPVDYSFANSYNYVMTLSLPDGYAVAEQPANVTVTFDQENEVYFQYRCSVQENLVTVISKLQMKRLFFLPEEYPDLRKFYDLIVGKNQEMLVLKKN